MTSYAHFISQFTALAMMSVCLYGASILVSAFLLFLVQPMVSKMVLPLLGGGPFVWNTCVFFFQTSLLIGYLYAHLTTAWLGVRRQAVLHSCLLILPLFFLPISVLGSQFLPSSERPVSSLLVLLTITIGVPFIAVAATSPLLQKWFSDTSQRSSRDPYFLYGASNIGSMLGLFSYPLVVERLFSLRAQGFLWSGGYILLALLQVGCAVYLFKKPISPGAPVPVNDEPAPANRLRKVTVKRRLHWIALSAVPASWMLGVTTLITTDLAPVPLLWVLPLATYLLTYVLVFSRRWKIPHDLTSRILLLSLLGVLLFHSVPISWQASMGVQLVLLFLGGIACHSRLATDRPDTSQLTGFYLWLSVGGMLGGFFNAFVAPQIFTMVLELPVSIVAACLLCYPSRISGKKWGRLPDFLIWTAATLVWLNVLFGYVKGAASESLVYANRNFFGVYRVIDNGEMVVLQHGTAGHGIQAKNSTDMCEPLSFYHPSGPLGDVFRCLYRSGFDDDVAVVGLGAGTVYSYSLPGQEFVFYEIDPLVPKIARRYFRYLGNCGKGEYRIVVGDGRLKLAEAPDKAYGLILLDAFNSDSIPVHLLTREALQIYLNKLTDDGLLVFHISNKFIDLEPVMAAIADDAGLILTTRHHRNLTKQEKRHGIRSTRYAVMARRKENLRGLLDLPEWREREDKDRIAPWTDQFSNILQLLR